MRLDFSYEPQPAEPDREEHETGPGYRHQTWRLRGSRGDAVHVSVWLPATAGPHPLVIAGHGATGDREAPYIKGAAKGWARTGLAVASIDFPNHGGRAGATSGPVPLWRSPELLQQAVGDLRGLVDVLEATAWVDSARLGYLGFSMGTLIGVPFVAVEPRVRAGVFAVAGSTRVLVEDRDDAERAVTAATDPATYAAGIAPRPVLMLCADRDEVFPRTSALALFDSFRPPKELVFFPGTHAGWAQPGRRYRVMRHFLDESLAP